MLTRLHARRWELLAQRNPLWAILSHPQYRDGGWDVDEFFATGTATVEGLLHRLETLGITPRAGRALDFGCGVGRLTQALAAHFPQVVGVDVAPTMIALADRYNRHPGRCRYTAWDGRRLPFADGSFDLVVSLITLQHMPPRLARRALREFGRVLARPGVLTFQCAAEPLPPRRRIVRWLPRPAYEWLREFKALLAPAPDFEMYGLPRSTVLELLRSQGLDLVVAEEDRAAGSGWTSFTYVAARRP